MTGTLISDIHRNLGIWRNEWVYARYLATAIPLILIAAGLLTGAAAGSLVGAVLGATVRNVRDGRAARQD